LHGLIDHALRQQQQMERIMETMKSAGLACPSMPDCDKLDSVGLNKLVD
jgi:serine O-acetyltransferase